MAPKKPQPTTEPKPAPQTATLLPTEWEQLINWAEIGVTSAIIGMAQDNKLGDVAEASRIACELISKLRGQWK